VRRIATIALIGLLAAPAQAQLFVRSANSPPVRPPPAKLPPAEADIWPYAPPDPSAWWTEKWPKPAETADPLGGRRVPRGQRLPAIEAGVDASTYRLWGLMPLQWEVLKGGESIVEVWVRPANSVRQSVMRITVRDDGKAFLQGRAGFACCEAGIGRRIAFDEELPPGSAHTFETVAALPVWNAPRMVRVDEGGGAASEVCVNGVSYDMTLVTRDQTRTLHRSCSGPEVGQVADILEPVLTAALGHDARFDVLYRGGASFAAERADFQDLAKAGGSIRPDTTKRARPPGAEPMPSPEG
jgi:hypothetical protein